MIRSILRTLSRFLMAIVLFALLLCAIEVWLRWERVNQSAGVHQRTPLDELLQPSKTTWLDVAELIDIEMPVGLQESTRLRTTEFGTRGGTVSVPKPEGKFRVLCLGGSQIFGMGQREEETIPGQLQALFLEADLSHVEFINAGCPQSGLTTNYLRLRKRLISLQPDLILYCLSDNDLQYDEEIRGGLTLDQNGKPAFAVHPATGTLDRDHISRVCDEFATADWLMTQIAPMIGLKESQGKVRPESEAQASNLKELVNIKEICDAYECNLMISIIPNAWNQNPKTGQMSSRNPHAFERDLHKYFSDHQIQSTALIHNPNSIFEQNAQHQDFFEQNSGTLSPMGNIMYARTIAKTLVDYHPTILQVQENPRQRPLPAPAVNPDAPKLLPLDSSAPFTSDPTSPGSVLR